VSISPSPLKRARAASTPADIIETYTKAMATSRPAMAPYRHWQLKNCLPDDTLDDLVAMPFAPPDLGGVSGKRELHNDTRSYFDKANQARHPAMAAVADAFQSRTLTRRIENFFGATLKGSYLRIEYALDADGFWLAPHSDLGVKLFTMLLYISKDRRHRTLGTDIYDAEKNVVGRSDFEPNAAFCFVPSDNTFHGFEKRPIAGVRKSIIINYVTDEWRAREQLSFPEAPLE